jgi:hypothetical protein
MGGVVREVAVGEQDEHPLHERAHPPRSLGHPLETAPPGAGSTNHSDDPRLRSRPQARTRQAGLVAEDSQSPQLTKAGKM